MYLSRLILNPRNRRVQSEVASPYEMHRSLMNAFPDDLDPDEERVLFRLEAEARDRRPTLLVQSWNMPDWSWLGESGAQGYLATTNLPNPAVKPFHPELSPDQTLVFRLRGNPTVKRDGKRVGLYCQDEQKEWLARKAEQSGMQVISARTSHEQIITTIVHRDSATHRVKLLSVRFDGYLHVRDPQKLLEAVRHGVGSAKAFGFGLLSLAPAKS